MEFIYNGNSRKSGVYKITNKTNGRTYIGSSKEFKSRWRKHELSLEKGTHYNKFLQRDYVKCGTDAFVFEIIELVPGDKILRIAAEQKRIDESMQTGLCYNLSKTATSPEGCHLKDPALTRKRQSAARKGKTLEELCGVELAEILKKNLSDKFIELWQDPDFIQKMKETKVVWNKGLSGYTTQPHSEETKMKISESQKGKTIPEEQRKKIAASVAIKNVELWKQQWYRDKVIAGRLGKVCSKETREKISASNKGKGKSEAHVQAMREAQKRRREKEKLAAMTSEQTDELVSLNIGASK